MSVLSGGDLCDVLITHAEECGVSEGKLETSTPHRAVDSLKIMWFSLSVSFHQCVFPIFYLSAADAV